MLLFKVAQGPDHDIVFNKAGDGFIADVLGDVKGITVGNSAQIDTAGDVAISVVGDDATITARSLSTDTLGECSLVVVSSNGTADDNHPNVGETHIARLGGGSRVYSPSIFVGDVFSNYEKLTTMSGVVVNADRLNNGVVVAFDAIRVVIGSVGDQAVVRFTKAQDDWTDGFALVVGDVGTSVQFVSAVPEYNPENVENMPSYSLTFAADTTGPHATVLGAFNNVQANSFGPFAHIDIPGALEVNRGGLSQSRFISAKEGVTYKQK